MESKVRLRLEHRILWERNGLPAHERVTLRCRMTFPEISQTMTDAEKIAAYNEIEADLDKKIATRTYDSVMTELMWKQRERRALLRVRWHL